LQSNLLWYPTKGNSIVVDVLRIASESCPCQIPGEMILGSGKIYGQRCPLCTLYLRTTQRGADPTSAGGPGKATPVVRLTSQEAGGVRIVMVDVWSRG